MSEATPLSVPLKKVRDALYSFRGLIAVHYLAAKESDGSLERCSHEALTALAPLEHALPVAMASHHQLENHHAGGDADDWDDCSRCKALLERKP